MDFRKGTKREDPEINLIPFIDVLLVILIFLMITTTYSKYTSLQITLPVADAEKAVEVARVTRPDVALLDGSMPGGGGVRAALGIGWRSFLRAAKGVCPI